MEQWVRYAEMSMPVVADLQCDYLQQVYFDDTIYSFTSK